MERPECCTDRHLEYLDEIRRNGRTNMLGSEPYLRKYFPELGRKEATDVLIYWMSSFGELSR